MNSTHIIPILLFVSCYTLPGQSVDPHPIIPDRWVREALETIRGYDTTAKGRLIDEFHGFVDPDETDSHEMREFGIWSVLQVVIVDLDNDGEPECLITIDGLDCPYWFCVLQRTDSAWQLLYRDGFWGLETALRPINIVHSGVAGRTLVYREDVSLSGGGRDYQYSSYSILCLIDDSVRTVAKILGDCDEWGTELSYLNIKVTTKLDFWGNGVTATHRFDLYPAIQREGKGFFDEWTDYESDPFLSGEIPVHHEWNDDSLKFIASQEENTSDPLKLSTFGGVDGLDLFDAFRAELDSVRAIATGRKKELIEYVYQRAEDERHKRE